MLKITRFISLSIISIMVLLSLGSCSGYWIEEKDLKQKPIISKDFI